MVAGVIGRPPLGPWLSFAILVYVIAVPNPFVTKAPVASGDSTSVAPAAHPETTLDDLGADAFLENAGQLEHPEVRFYATMGTVRVGFADNAVLLTLADGTPRSSQAGPGPDPFAVDPRPEPNPSRGVTLRLSFKGANEVVPQGRNPLSYPTHFFLGNDPAKWRTDVRSYREIVYEELYDGIDLIYRAGERGVKYDFVLAPGTEVSAIAMSYEGAEGLELTTAGDLLVHTAVGDLRDSSPIAYQDDTEVACSFVSLSRLAFGFTCRGVDASREVVIDPLLYATYLGGGNEDYGWGNGNDDYGSSVAVDAAGNAYVTGTTYSWDFPTTPGAFDIYFARWAFDAFVAKLDPTGSSLAYATFLGGEYDDRGQSIAVDAAGNAYVTGYTFSDTFPTTQGAFKERLNQMWWDSFVAKLDPAGSSLLYATYLGGGNPEDGFSIAVDAAGNAYVTGYTRSSSSFPVTPGAFDTTCTCGANSRDSFVVKVNPTGSSLVYATFLGGNGDEDGFSIAVDAAGNAYVAGNTYSTDFPTTPGAFDVILDGRSEGFLVKLNPAGSALVYSTFLGGGSSEVGYSVAVDTVGNAYVSGFTYSTDFPVTPDAFDTSHNGDSDGFVAKLNPAGSTILYATYLGGDNYDYGKSIALDAAGSAYVAGYTYSTDFPVTPGAIDTSHDGPFDAFVARFDATNSSLLNATYLGGGNDDRGLSIAVDGTGNAYVTGQTFGGDFPVTPGAFDTSHNGDTSWDAFVAKLKLGPTSPVIVSAALTGSGFQDLSLTWTPAPLDGSPGGPTEYRVLHAPALGGPFTEIASISATGSPSYSFTCPACGHVPGETNTTFYRVRAVSANATTDSNLAARYAKAVQAGPHLLAVPLEQAKYAIPAVLQTLTHGVVRTFRAADAADPWKAWHPARPGDLATLAFGDAMWVDVTAAGQYTVAGLVRLNPIVPLSAGWNLVGYAAFVSETRDVSLAEAPGVVRVEAFDPASADPYRLRVVAGTEMLVPGEGFWVLLVSGGGLWVQG